MTVVLLQGFNSFVCYKHDWHAFVAVLGYFVALPLVPALVSLLTTNPLRAVVSAIFFAPWLVFAYVTDCFIPYTGGGASMVYVAVILFGLPSALIGACLGGLVTRKIGIEIYEG